MTTTEIAAAAGVSRAAVSYVLNDRPDSGISQTTAQRIRDAARSMGYVPSAAARILRSGRSNLALGLLPAWDLGSPFPEIFRGLGDRLERLGYDLVLRPAGATAVRVEQLLRSLTPALVISPTDFSVDERELFGGAGIPVHYLDIATFVGLIGRTQANFLIDVGYERLIYAQPDHHVPEALSAPRFAAMGEVARIRGVAPPHVARLPYTAKALKEFVREYMEEGCGICAHSDELAAFLFASLGRERFGGKTELGLLGVGDSPVAHLGISTVKLDIEYWADAWFEPLETILVSGREPLGRRDLSMEVIARSST